jgi:hypothetical protein
LGIPTGILALLSARSIGFGKCKKAKVLWGCSMLAVIWVLWLERNRRIFEDVRGAGLEELWIRVKYVAALGATVSSEFRDYSISLIMPDWREVVI